MATLTAAGTGHRVQLAHPTDARPVRRHRDHARQLHQLPRGRARQRHRLVAPSPSPNPNP
eukprot:scaffold75713_cov38-Phaeocystis_antarctica.AAC.2